MTPLASMLCNGLNVLFSLRHDFGEADCDHKGFVVLL